jgi:hypothetical protein
MPEALHSIKHHSSLHTDMSPQLVWRDTLARTVLDRISSHRKFSRWQILMPFYRFSHEGLCVWLVCAREDGGNLVRGEYDRDRESGVPNMSWYD